MVDPTWETPSDDINGMLWQVFNAGCTNIMGDLKSEARAYKQTATIVAQNLPWPADVWDAYAFATWKDLYSGEDVSGWNRALAWVAAFIPGVSGSEARVTSTAIKSSWLVNKLNHIFWKSAHNMTALLDKFWWNQQKALDATTKVANQAFKDWKLQIWKDGVLPKVWVILNVNGVKVQMIWWKVVDWKVVISSLSRSWLK